MNHSVRNLHEIIFKSSECEFHCTVTNYNFMFSDHASWIDYILINNLMHWLLFIHKILFPSTCFEPQVLIFRRVQLYTCSIWYHHSSWWPLGTQLEFSIRLCTKRPPRTLIESDSTICCMCTSVPSWRWALEAWNM